MEKSPTLFNYLHDALVQQIVSGKIAYGEKLPPLRTLCELYHVGIRTVRDVMDALVKEGYVESVQRSHIKAVYRTDADTVQQVRTVLARKDMVYALLKTLAFIMPPIYAGACRFCDDNVIRACRGDIVGINALGSKEQWQLSRVSFQRIKAVYKNNLLQDLCVDFDVSAQILIVPGFVNPYEEMTVDSEKGLNHFFDCVESCNDAEVYNIISKMYQTAGEFAEVYFAQLNSVCPMEKPEQERYHWVAERGRLRLHMQVTRSIIKKIIRGIYKDGDYLPASSKLREEYSISTYTVGKVLESLERMGLVKKMNQRGGYLITCGNACKKNLFVKGSASSLDAIAFLEAIHLLALISEGVAMLSFEYIDGEVLESLNEIVKTKRVLALSSSIMAKLIQIQPYDPLKVVFRELEKLVDWGCYISFAFNGAPVYDTIQEKSKSAIQCIYSGSPLEFAQALKKIYSYFFEVMRKTLVDLGIEEANKFRL